MACIAIFLDIVSFLFLQNVRITAHHILEIKKNCKAGRKRKRENKRWFGMSANIIDEKLAQHDELPRRVKKFHWSKDQPIRKSENYKHHYRGKKPRHGRP